MNFYLTVGFGLLLLVNLLPSATSEEGPPHLFLTVSSYVPLPGRNFTGRLLQMNWDPEHPLNDEDSSWVGIFNHDPRENPNQPLESIRTALHPAGLFQTRIYFPHYQFTPLNLSSDCLDFYIAYFHADSLQASTCIRPQPRWMQDQLDVIGSKNIMQIAIPGTHNAGCYEEPEVISRTLSAKYKLTQDEDIWNQLVYGIRYLDLRVAYLPNRRPERFWITHYIYPTTHSVRDVLRQVREFLARTQEIVILDFHRFENNFRGNAQGQRHSELMSLLESELDMDLVVPVRLGYLTRIADLMRIGKRLFITYASPFRKMKDYLFPEVQHVWGNADALPNLESFFNRKACENNGTILRSAMAQLTPTAAGLIFDRYSGLRKMAQDVNLHVTTWFRDRWWNCSNIISTDFFLGSDIINVAIASNRIRV